MTTTKLSTDVLRSHMQEWLAKSFPLNRFNMNRWTVDEIRADYNLDGKLPIDATVEYCVEYLRKIWTNPKNWRRDTKCRVEKAPEEVIYEGEFFIDDVGDFNKKYADKINDDGYVNKCWYRSFHAPEPFDDNYYMFVVTTPDDTDVIGWTTRVD